MAIDLNIGDTVPLSLLLEDGATDKFPVAWLYNQNNVLLTPTPVTLYQDQLGRYIDDSFEVTSAMTHIRAVYIVYEDSGHTVPSLFYAQSEDEFDIRNSSGSGVPVRVEFRVPEQLSIPHDVDKTYRIYIDLFDQTGFPIDPDSQAVTLTFKDLQGNILMAAQAMTKEQVGTYYYDYTLHFDDAPQTIILYFNFNIATAPFQYTDTSESIKTLDDVTQILDILDTINTNIAQNVLIGVMDSQCQSIIGIIDEDN